MGLPCLAQWLRICLPIQGTQVRALVWEDPTFHGATKPVRHKYQACAPEPTSHNYWAHVPQLLKPVHLEPMLRNKRSHRNEKLVHPNKEQSLLAATRESPHAAMKTQPSQKKNKIKRDMSSYLPETWTLQFPDPVRNNHSSRERRGDRQTIVKPVKNKYSWQILGLPYWHFSRRSLIHFGRRYITCHIYCQVHFSQSCISGRK